MNSNLSVTEKSLLKKKVYDFVNLKTKDSQEVTALHLASYIGNPMMITRLV